jgi:hypothetical protein
MEMPRGRALALSAAGGILAAMGTSCAAAPVGPATPPPMPEYPPDVGRPTPSPVAVAVAAPHADTEEEANDLVHAMMSNARGGAADARLQLGQPKGCCKATNTCKGKGNCKTGKHACKGLNDCKGQGGCKPIRCP